MADEANQSASLPVSSITCSAPTQTSSSMKPVVSIGALRVGVSRPRMPRQQSQAQMIPTGTLIRKIHGHAQLSQIQPPRIGPVTGATSVVIDQIASAVPR